MAKFVLVHGAWLGSWCWSKVTPMLEAEGHRVLTPDLPGHGADRTPISEISLQGYTDHIGSIVTAQTEPVVLVGHSMAGTVISQVAEQWPASVSRLCYVAAFLLTSGQSLFDVGGQDAESHLGPNLMPNPDAGEIGVNSDSLIDIFFADCDPADVASALALVKPEPLAPLATPITVTDARFGSVPRTYIHTRQDHAVSIGVQKRMVAETPCEKVLSIDTGHAPFLAAPEQLAAYLTSLAS